MSTIKSNLGLTGQLGIKIIRAHPSFWQRFNDWLQAIFRRT